MTPPGDELAWNGISLMRLGGEHGGGAVLAEMGPAIGFVLRGSGESILSWPGDTVLAPPVRAAIARLDPDVVAVHACGATWGTGTPIGMDAAQAIEVCRLAPWATAVATRMDAVDHATFSRADLRATVRAVGIDDGRCLIPLDGEVVVVGGAPAEPSPAGRR